jgi:hypothetical protein
MFVGLAKLPKASDNCAVKILPLLKVPVFVNGIRILSPAHKVVGLTVPTVIDWA